MATAAAKDIGLVSGENGDDVTGQCEPVVGCRLRQADVTWSVLDAGQTVRIGQQSVIACSEDKWQEILAANPARAHWAVLRCDWGVVVISPLVN